VKDSKQEGMFQQSVLEARVQFEHLLEDFDRFVLDLKGNPESDSAKHFKSLLEAQAGRLIQHLKILSAIFNISSLFSSHSRLNEVLSLIVESVKEVLNFSRVIILLLNRDRTLLECKIIGGMTFEQKMIALSRPFIMDKHDCVETKVARYGESYLIKDVNDPRLTDTDRKIIMRTGRGCTIYVPIVSKNGIIGVLGVDRQSSLPLLQPADVDRVQIFANSIGVLIENAKLYESIVEHKNRFENIVRQSPNGIIIIDFSGKINLINRAAEKLMGINKAQFLGASSEKLLGTELSKKIARVLSEQDRAQFYDLTIERPDGQALILNLAALNIKNENRLELVIILQDITEKKMIDKHLQRLDRLASIGTMAAGIAHEIRSPLTSISVDLDSLYESGLGKEKVQQTIIQVLDEIERIDKTLANLLQFSRPARKEFSRFELVNVINEALVLARKKVGKKRIHFRTHFPSAPLEVTGSPDRLKQMIVNLLINAIEAVELEGVITMQIELLKENNVYMSKVLKNGLPNKHNSTVKIGIGDTGLGIPWEYKDKIFDPYFTTKRYGTGLGLAIVSKIAEEHHGYVSVSSKPGQGALFEVFVPKAH
jgi:PAS domain S-box-containing protein